MAPSEDRAIHDAIQYMREVKSHFMEHRQVYDRFMEILKDFKNSRIDTSGVVVHIKRLFKNHPELILGFNAFLPEGYEIQISHVGRYDEYDAQQVEDEDVKVKVEEDSETDQASNYVAKVQERFSNDEASFQAYLELLDSYRQGHIDISQVYAEVGVLFRDHPDLMHEFMYFLPDTAGQEEGAAAQPHDPADPQQHAQVEILDHGQGATILEVPPPDDISQQDAAQQHYGEQPRMAVPAATFGDDGGFGTMAALAAAPVVVLPSPRTGVRTNARMNGGGGGHGATAPPHLYHE